MLAETILPSEAQPLHWMLASGTISDADLLDALARQYYQTLFILGRSAGSSLEETRKAARGALLQTALMRHTFSGRKSLAAVVGANWLAETRITSWRPGKRKSIPDPPKIETGSHPVKPGLSDVLEKLSLQERQVLLLCALMGLDGEEIAGLLGVQLKRILEIMTTGAEASGRAMGLPVMPALPQDSQHLDILGGLQALQHWDAANPDLIAPRQHLKHCPECRLFSLALASHLQALRSNLVETSSLEQEVTKAMPGMQAELSKIAKRRQRKSYGKELIFGLLGLTCVLIFVFNAGRIDPPVKIQQVRGMVQSFLTTHP